MRLKITHRAAFVLSLRLRASLFTTSVSILLLAAGVMLVFAVLFVGRPVSGWLWTAELPDAGV